MNCLVIREDPELVQVRKEIARRYRTYRENRIMVWAAFSGFVFGITPKVFEYATSARGGIGIGGEVIFPMLPFILFPAYNMICSKIWKKVRKSYER